MLRFPRISCNALTCLKPEFIGLAAWLGQSGVYPTDRARIMKYVGQHGTIDEGALYQYFDGNAENLAAAAEAHAEWQRFLADVAALDAAQSAAAKPITFYRTNGVNGHIVPPLAGGAPVAIVSPIAPNSGHQAQECDRDDDDMSF